jgi:molecular chaperone HtpG
VRDNGAGMTSDVVKNYFLKAGASFRRSDAWKRQHETSGKPRVLRSGRFGIGVLAAFLLGDQVEVLTRHISNPSDHGIQFSASIDDEAIELQRVHLPDIGTTVRVRLPKGTVAKFKRKYSSPWDNKWDWDWYFLQDPAVRRTLTAERQPNQEVTTEVLQHEYFLPGPQTKLPTDWHRISHEDFDDIHWHFPEKPDNRREDAFFCNGIKVAGAYGGKPHIERKLNWQLSVREPVLSIFDGAGKLPLNLARSNLTRELAFERDLLEDIYRDLISFLIVHTPVKPLCDTKTAQIFGEISYPGNHGHNWFWTTPEGLSLANKWFLRRLSPPNLYLVPELTALRFHLPKRYAYIASFDRTRSGFGYYDSWVRFALTGTGFESRWLEGLKAKGRRLLVSAHYEDRIKGKKVIPKTFFSTMIQEWRDDNWVVLSTKNCPPPNVSFQQLASQAKPDVFTMLAEWYLEPSEKKVADGDDSVEGLEYVDREDFYLRSGKVESKDSVLVPIWRDLIGESAIIPFDIKRRNTSLAEAIRTLEPYIAFHRTISRKSTRK